jgi:hypothetical protein
MPVFDSLKIPKMKVEVHDGIHPNKNIENKRKDIHGYPSIFYYNDNTNAFKEYSDSRQAKELIIFYNENNKNQKHKKTYATKRGGGKTKKTKKTKKTNKIKNKQ